MLHEWSKRFFIQHKFSQPSKTGEICRRRLRSIPIAIPTYWQTYRTCANRTRAAALPAESTRRSGTITLLMCDCYLLAPDEWAKMKMRNRNEKAFKFYGLALPLNYSVFIFCEVIYFPPVARCRRISPYTYVRCCREGCRWLRHQQCGHICGKTIPGMKCK